MEKQPKIRDSKKARATVDAYNRGYTINEDGHALSPKGKIRKAYTDTKGYYRFAITFRVGVKSVTIQISHHQLAAYQKFGSIALSEGVLVRHKDGVSTNNRPGNIQIGTSLDNYHDRPPELRNLDAIKISKTLRKLTDPQVFDLRSDRVNGMKIRDLCEKYSICRYTCNNILKGVTYKDLTKGLAVKKPLKPKPEKKGPSPLNSRRLSDDQALSFLGDRSEGMSLNKLSKKYNLSKGACASIVHRRTYKDIHRIFDKTQKITPKTRLTTTNHINYTTNLVR